MSEPNTISQKQLDANRGNARKSTGPRTPEGKAKSCMNGTRHGLTGQVTVMTGEDREAHDKFVHAFIAHLGPDGPVEYQIAQSIAEDSWRMNRMRAVENNMFASGHFGKAGDFECNHPQVHAALTQANVFMDQAHEFQLLSLYETRLDRKIQRNLALLEELKTRRPPVREKALAAGAAPQLIPAPEPHVLSTLNGFAFSKSERIETGAAPELPPDPEPHVGSGLPPCSRPSGRREPLNANQPRNGFAFSESESIEPTPDSPPDHPLPNAA